MDFFDGFMYNSAKEGINVKLLSGMLDKSMNKGMNKGENEGMNESLNKIMNVSNVVNISMNNRRRVTLCNHNFSLEGILHPDRVMDEYDLLFMQDGEWDIIEDEITYHLVPGSVLLLEPGKHHYSIEKCSPMMRNVYIHFAKDEDADKGLCLSIPKLIQTADNREIHHGFEKVIDAFWSRDEESIKALRCSLYLEELLMKLSDLGRLSNGRADVLVSEIIHRFHCEPERFLSPEELAINYGVSVRTISGRFKEQTGMSIHRYQLQVKLEMAYDLLPISPGRSLHDIALSYGFYDEFQFSKLFKRQFGISPSERR